MQYARATIKKMADELGDVLLQIVMHAEIGSENGTFTIDDVTDAISQKMLSRHPHVFGDAVADTSEKVLDNWEKIKQKERGQKSVCESINSITPSLPALMRCDKVIEKISKKNFPETYKNVDITDNELMIGEKLYQI